jgi:3-hydroxyisobutyrate dehydrogenase-like beta-hydroxyacid dehydrogenase
VSEEPAEIRVVAVLGLGEAGGAISRDLLAAGVTVRGYDPAVAVPEGVVATGSDAEACAGADLVLSLTTAHEAEAAFSAAGPGLSAEVLYADLNTSSADLKQRLAAMALQWGIGFADVAMMAPVPGRGIRTPMLVSGEAADPVAAALAGLGGNAEAIAGPAGAAASRKLCRSVFYKGMAAAVTESLRAGRAAGCEDWLRESIAEDIGTDMLNRLEQGSITHAARRTDEMAAAADLLGELGIPPRIAVASRDWLAQLTEENLSAPAGGHPHVPPVTTNPRKAELSGGGGTPRTPHGGHCPAPGAPRPPARGTGDRPGHDRS